MSLPPEIKMPPVVEAPHEITGFPSWIKLCGALLGLLVVVSAVRIGPAFNAAILVERAHRHIAAGDFAKAASELAPVVNKYPDSDDLRLDLAQAQISSGDTVGAIKTISPLSGKDASKEDADRADQIAAQIDQKFTKDGK